MANYMDKFKNFDLSESAVEEIEEKNTNTQKKSSNTKPKPPKTKKTSKVGRPQKEAEKRKQFTFYSTDTRWEYVGKKAHNEWPKYSSISDYINMLIDKDMEKNKTK